MGLFSGIGQADVGQSRGTYFEPDRNFVVQVKRTLFRDGRNGKFYIGEFLVLESDSPANPRGSSASWLQKMSGDSSEVALGAIKAYIAAALGADPGDAEKVKALFSDDAGNDVTEDIAELSVTEGPENPLTGSILRLQTRSGKTKKTGAAFTFHNWSPALPGDEAKVL